jgi:general secretion pathway protein G
MWLVMPKFDRTGDTMTAASRFIVKQGLPPPIENFHRDVGRYPTSDEGLSVLVHAPEKNAERWKGPYVGGPIPADPWGHPFQYRLPATRASAAFDVWSFGPDGIESRDDIGNWTK